MSAVKGEKRIAREVRLAVEAELLRWPGVDWQYVNGTNHGGIEVYFDGKRQRIPLAQDVNCWRVLPGTLSQVRAHLKFMGALRAADEFFDEPLEPRRKRVRIPRPLPTPRISDPRADGWAPLRELWVRIFGQIRSM